MIFKIISVGDQNVGKTTLFNNLVNNFIDTKTSSTIGVDYFQYDKIYNGEYKSLDQHSFKFSIWDLSGASKFINVIRPYFESLHAIIIVFDLTNQESMENIEKWIKEIERVSMELEMNKIPGMIIGNKKDLKNKIDTTLAQSIAKKMNYTYLELSSINNLDQFNIKEGFEEFFENIVDCYNDLIPRSRSASKFQSHRVPSPDFKMYNKKSHLNNDKKCSIM